MKPIIGSKEAFDLFRKSAEEAQNHLFSAALGALGHFSDQLNFPKIFDQTNTLKELPAYDMPNIDKYYKRIVECCLNTRWGRNAPTTDTD